MQLVKSLNNKYLPNLLKKCFIILCFSSLFINPYINNNFQLQIGRITNSVFKEIISFEKNLDLSKQIFDEFRKINCDNILLYKIKAFIYINNFFFWEPQRFDSK